MRMSCSSCFPDLIFYSTVSNARFLPCRTLFHLVFSVVLIVSHFLSNYFTPVFSVEVFYSRFLCRTVLLPFFLTNCFLPFSVELFFPRFLPIYSTPLFSVELVFSHFLCRSLIPVSSAKMFNPVFYQLQYSTLRQLGDS